MQLRLILLTLLTMTSLCIRADAPTGQGDRPYTVEYYYRIKWGYKDEWMQLYKRSHWPIMVLEMKQGHILDIKVHEPHNYAPESHRWDLRVSITYKSALERYDTSERREKNLAQLFPNRAQQHQDENRRRELLEELWEHAIKPTSTDGWLTTASP
jgi:hypothetical protein